MTNGKRNKSAGNSWERETFHILNDLKIFPETGTARDLSRFYDKNKIDIVTKDLGKMEELGLAIQNKSTTIAVSYPKLLNIIKTNLKKHIKRDLIPVIFNKQTEKVNTRFMERDRFACLFLDDFLKIYTDMKRYQKGFEILNDHFDFLPTEEAKEVNKELEKIGL